MHRRRSDFRNKNPHRTALLASIVLLFALVPGIAPRAAASPGRAAPDRLAVVANRLVNAEGQTLHLTGVNRSGTEYACEQGWGIFDGPTDAASIRAMQSWGINAVRVPLNEDCWLGINDIDPAYGATAYRAAIVEWVDRLRADGIAVILDLHWAGAGSTARSDGQTPMPDADHSPAFWRSVAAAFEDDPDIAFELFNEPHGVSWACWAHGCTVSAANTVGPSATATSYQATGMQQLIDAVRSTGATQPILVDGLDWANDLSGWASQDLTDPDHQLVAAWHVYEGNSCDAARCWDAIVAPLAAKVPVVVTEFGQTDCGTAFSISLMRWADQHALSYLAWTWDDWAGCGGPSLIASYSGTPTTFGSAIRAHYRSLSS